MGTFYDRRMVENQAMSLMPVTVDPDDNRWRSGTSDLVKEDLTAASREKVIKIARYLWLSNPIAHRLVEMLVAFTVGGGIQFVAKDPDAQIVLTKFWSDPVNAWPMRLPPRVRELILYGEQFYHATVNQQNGRVRLTYLNPLDVKSVNVSPSNIEVVKSITVTGSAMAVGADKEYPAVAYNDMTGRMEGEMFAFALNKSSDATRGVSDLITLVDWLGMYDELLFNYLERTQHMNSWLWDVKLEGMSEQQIKAWLKTEQGKLPKPGSLRAHNEKVTWSTASPSLGVAETAEAAKTFLLHILGGFGLPSFFSGGGDKNRAVATEEVEPTHKMFIERQDFVRNMLLTIFRFVLDCAVVAGELKDNVDKTVSIFMPRISLRDSARQSASVERVGKFLAMAQEKEMLTPEECRQVALAIINQLGVIDLKEAISGSQ